eukprot:jgi/Psemu1/15008/gm1.15008_g
MTNPEKQNRKPVDDLQTVAMMQSIEQMKDHKKKETITKTIDYILAKKYIPRTNGAECIFEVIENFCHYLRLKHQYQLPTEIQMKIAVTVFFSTIKTERKWMAYIRWMMIDKLNKGFYGLAEEDERWIDFKQHWNTHLKRLYQAVPLEELEDGTENMKESCRQARRHKRAKEGDESVIARSETYMDTKPHENYMTKLQDGEKKQMIEDVLNNISKIAFTPSGNCRGGMKYFRQVKDVCSKGKSDCYYEIPQAVKMEKAIQGFLKLNLRKEDLNKAYVEWMEIAGTLEKDKMGRYFHVHWICPLEGMNERVDQTAQNKREFRASYWKQELKKYFEKSDTYDGIQKVTNPVKKNSIKSALEYIENLKYTLMTNGVEHYFEFMENLLFDTLKQINGYVTPIELRMKVAATQFCNSKNEGILMYMIHKKWVDKHIFDGHRMMEQDWIDFKQHWDETIGDMYHESKRLKVKAEASDMSVKEMAEKYMNTEQHRINLSKMKDGGKKRELGRMVDNIWKLKFCPKKGAKCYFREFDALWEETHTTCDYGVPIEICMQKATRAFWIAELPWNVTIKANLDWGDENEDETNPFSPDNEDDSGIGNNEKVNDGRDEIKAPHRWNKACKRCADKKAKRKCRYCESTCRSKNRNKRNSPNKKKLKKAEEASKKENKSGNEQKIDGKINLEDETPEQSLERIATSHNMTVEELLKENKIFKDDNPENPPENKIERKGSKKGNYKEVSSGDNSNEKEETEDEIMSGKEADELPKEKRTHMEEEDKKNKEKADPIAVATDPALQKGGAENIEEKSTKTTDTSENNEREEKQKTWIDYLPIEEEDKKNEKEAANYTAQIAVARNPTLQEDDTDKNQEAAANNTDPIAVTADCALQEDGAENMEE